MKMNLAIKVIICFIIGYLLSNLTSKINNFSISIANPGKENITDNKSLKIAVNLWLSNKKDAKIKYGDINNWDTSKVTDMSHLFSDATSFNDDISKWDTSLVTDMNNMFYSALIFNQTINKKGVIKSGKIYYAWDTSKVRDMSKMFYSAESFDDDISNWDTRNVNNMSSMFYNANNFDKDLSQWKVSNVTDMLGMFYQSGLSKQNKIKIYRSWCDQVDNKILKLALPDLQDCYIGYKCFGGSCVSASGANDTVYYYDDCSGKCTTTSTPPSP